MKFNYDINLFRNPDEAYIIELNNDKTIIKILEKKENYCLRPIKYYKNLTDLPIGGSFYI